MYISGQKTNFGSRLHQLPAGISEVNQFITEGRGYLTSGIVLQTSGQWEKEARLKKFQISQSGVQLNTQQF